MNIYLKSFAICFMLIVQSLVVIGQKNEAIVPPLVPIDENTKLITYQYTITMKGTPEELYKRAYDWANTYYKNPTQAIKKADAQNKVIECVSSIKITTPSKDGKSFVMAGLVYYNLKIEMRSDRYRYTITNFNLRGASNLPIEIWLDQSRKDWIPTHYEHLRQVDEAVKILMEELEAAMEPKAVIKDEW